jgi:hypothetical protein
MGIILLIQHGADVYAEDHLGRSPSDFAYCSGVKSCREKLGSMRGDVWDFALAVCGYDISEFRSRHGRYRKARYGTSYTRQDFEELWQGQEHLCPYYDAEEDCSSDENMESYSDEEDEDEWATTDSEDEAVDAVDLQEE